MVASRVDALDMRRTMGKFATGVAVLTTEVDGHLYGATVNSLTSVSLDPPMLLVCLDQLSRSAAAVSAAGGFVISVLSAHQQHVAASLARSGADALAELPLEYHGHQAPVVPHALAHLECDVDRAVEAGDHLVFFARVVATCQEPRGGRPLGFFEGQYCDILPGMRVPTTLVERV